MLIPGRVCVRVLCVQCGLQITPPTTPSQLEQTRERRAAAVAQFLRAQGVDGSRILTISYGKERPVALGSSEAIRARNRRAQMIIMLGGKN